MHNFRYDVQNITVGTRFLDLLTKDIKFCMSNVNNQVSK